MTFTWWVKNGKMKYETIFDDYEEQKGIMIVREDEQEMYMYLPNEGIAMKYPYNPEEADESAIEEVEGIPEVEYDIEGFETLDGKNCLVITYYPGSEVTNTVWIWTENGFPLKSITNTPAGEYIAEYTNIDFSPIDDDVFEIPEGVEIIDFGGIPGF